MDDNPALKLALSMIKVSGQNIENDTTISKFFTVVSLILVGSMQILGFMEPIKHFNVDSLPGSFEIISNYYLYLSTLFVFRRQLKTFKELIAFEDFWPINYVSQSIAKKQKNTYRFVYRGFKFLLMISIGVYVTVFTLPLFSETRQLPLLCYQIVDFFQNPYYQILNVWVFVNGVFIFSLVIGLDGLFYALLSFVYCQITMLKEAVKNMDMENIETAEDEEQCFEIMKKYIMYHSKLLEYFKKINKAYSFLMLNQFMTIILNCSMPLYLILKNGLSDMGVLTKATLSMMANLWHLFMQCAAATTVIDQMESLGNSIYESKWNNKVSSRLRMGMLMIIQRSQRGHVLAAGGVININMENFTSILRITFSCYTLLQSMNEY